MKSILFFAVLFLNARYSPAQNNKTYTDSIKTYQQNYVTVHEVVKGKSKKYFRFFPVDKVYRMHCRFEASADTAMVIMKTSGKKIPEKYFIRYGKIFFTLNDTALQLTVYQSRQTKQHDAYKDYLFIPFTDITTGDETYGSGRYIDILTSEIKNNQVTIDFNKAYNPYCAFSNGYNCPIPLRENDLPVAVKAGEKNFAKPAAH
jgi:uncharacterized protein